MRTRSRRSAGGCALLGALTLLGGCFVDPGAVPTTGAQATGSGTSTGGSSTTTTGGEGSSSSSSAGGSSSTTGGELGEPVAFRIKSLTGVDPHYYGELMMGSCADLTSLFNLGINNELDNGDVSYVMIFYPADPKASESPLRILTAQCNGALDTCSPGPDDPGVMTVAHNSQDALCSTIVAGSLNAAYSMDGVPNIPGAPCFVSDEAEASIPLSDTLPPVVFKNLVLAATYVDDGKDVTGLIKGTLRGYLTQTNALKVDGVIAEVMFNLWGSIAGGGSCNVDINDLDPNPEMGGEPGVWVYFNFEAQLIEWLE